MAYATLTTLDFLPSGFAHVICWGSHHHCLHSPRLAMHRRCVTSSASLLRVFKQNTLELSSSSQVTSTTSLSLSSILPIFYQFVKCKTRTNKTLDLLYVKVTIVYSFSALPPPSRSHHNLVTIKTCSIVSICSQWTQQPIACLLIILNVLFSPVWPNLILDTCPFFLIYYNTSLAGNFFFF